MDPTAELKESERNKDQCILTVVILIYMHIEFLHLNLSLKFISENQFVHYGSILFENALYCAVAVRDNYECCKYVKYCVFSVYDFVYTSVNTSISLVQSVLFVYV